jgi:hypothetical protein
MVRISDTPRDNKVRFSNPPRKTLQFWFSKYRKDRRSNPPSEIVRFSNPPGEIVRFSNPPSEIVRFSKPSSEIVRLSDPPSEIVRLSDPLVR